MPEKPVRQNLQLVLEVICCTVLCSSLVNSGRGEQSRPAESTSARGDGPEKLYAGTESCRKCHNYDKKIEDAQFPPICQCNEFRIWDKSDKHKNAYRVLHDDKGELDARGQQMGKILGKDVTKAETGCISCHAVNTGTEKVDKKFKVQEGVTCVVCHGPYLDWVDEHGSEVQLKRERWRGKSRSEKEIQFGMTDLWDSAKRAKLCASCHIGNAHEGKFVTHAMYAAGHPPLPGFEVATFSYAMPRHWEALGKKDPAVQQLLNYDPAKLEQVELVWVSAATSFREAMNLIAAQAMNSSGGDQPQPLLDFANFDCYACHHDLKVPSWRAMRGYRAAPGRPMPRPWPTALMDIAVRHAEQNDDKASGELKKFNDQMRKLTLAFAARPFGNPTAIAAAATELTDWADQLVKRLQLAQYTQADAKKFLVQLGSVSRAEHLDYDSARQIAWAFKMIYSQLDPKPAGHSEVEREMEELNLQLNLTLPSGQDKGILKELPSALKRIGDFDPPKFRLHMDELAELLK